MQNQLTIQDFTVQENQYLMSAEQLGLYLGYSDPQKGISNIYNRNTEELEPFKGFLKMRTPGGFQDVLHFNEQGCYIIAMLAKTEKAKEFRRQLALIIPELSSERFLQYEINKKKQELAKLELKLLIHRSGKLTRSKVKRMAKAKDAGLFTNEELARAFDLDRSYFMKIIKMYRESLGDFRDLEPGILKTTRERLFAEPPSKN